jgi:catechol 2,3-dioxygenase-like lactoylglutathione lyase family enzyme
MVKPSTRRSSTWLASMLRPRSLADGKLNDWNGGRGVYFRDPDGHILELMTVPQ